MGWSGDKLSKPISLGDVSSATGIGPVNGTQYDLGYMLKNGTWNTMARRKPVRHTSPGVLDEAAFASTRYGFGGTNIKTLGSSFEAVWEYLRPRGIHGTTDNPTSSDEWYRTLDFDGYSRTAVAPLKTEMMDCYYGSEQYQATTGGFSVLLKFNGSVTGWNTSDSIKFREFIQGGSSFWSYYLAYLFWDTSNNERNFIVTKDKLSDVLINDDMQWGNGF